MLDFKIIKDVRELDAWDKKGYQSALVNSSMNRDEKGEIVESDYKGKRYRIVAIRERDFSSIARVYRYCLGLLLKIGSCFRLPTDQEFIKALFHNKKERIRFGMLVEKEKKKKSKPIGDYSFFQENEGKFTDSFFGHTKIPYLNNQSKWNTSSIKTVTMKSFAGTICFGEGPNSGRWACSVSFTDNTKEKIVLPQLFLRQCVKENLIYQSQLEEAKKEINY